jgi:hypothetical protein
MAKVTMGVLHPGEMAASVGAAARYGGADVVWASYPSLEEATGVILQLSPCEKERRR